MREISSIYNYFQMSPNSIVISSVTLEWVQSSIGNSVTVYRLAWKV